MSEEKTEKPTAKRRKENRKQGKVPRTPDLGAWSALTLFALALPKLIGHELQELQKLMTSCLTASGEQADVPSALTLLGDGLWHVMITLVALGAMVMVVGVAGALAQGGFFLATSNLKPNFSKLNPLKGLKRLFGMRTLWEGGKMLLKSSVVILLVWSAVKAAMPMIGGLVPIQVLIDHTAGTALGLVRNVALIGVVLAGADYLVQRKQMDKQTKMTKDEVKQEHKQSEGDPMVKSAIRSRQLAAARNRMMADIPNADVVLVNPTHVAVALSYDPQRGAPRVVARGAGVIATAIREKAGESKVPLVRDVPLARALYTSCRVGQEIPPELFAAVAQVLAFVISRRTRGYQGGQHDTPRGGLDELPEVKPGPRRRQLPSGSSAAGR